MLYEVITGGLAAGMAHEINNPLAGILQNLQVMRNRLTHETGRNIEAARQAGTTLEAIRAYMEARGLIGMMDTISEAGRRAAKIVDNMLSFSRITSYNVCYTKLLRSLNPIYAPETPRKTDRMGRWKGVRVHHPTIGWRADIRPYQGVQEPKGPASVRPRGLLRHRTRPAGAPLRDQP